MLNQKFVTKSGPVFKSHDYRRYDFFARFSVYIVHKVPLSERKKLDAILYAAPL